jgi:hypothetical protein
MTAMRDWTGHRFGKLSVIELAARNPARWRCVCDCGNEKIAYAGDLVQRKIVSCGCFKREILATSGYKHGMHNSGAWQSWSDMIKRCTNPKADAYKHYGGRGIKVCDRWLEFVNFHADMGDRPSGMTLERQRVNEGYNPENCEWIPAKDQSLNTRRTVRVVLDGEEMALSAACKRLGLSYNRVRDRMKTLGWTFERAIAEPKKVNGTLYAEV